MVKQSRAVERTPPHALSSLAELMTRFLRWWLAADFFVVWVHAGGVFFWEDGGLLKSIK